jgi:hypothetical protein
MRCFFGCGCILQEERRELRCVRQVIILKHVQQMLAKRANGFNLVDVPLDDDERTGPGLGVNALVKRASAPGARPRVKAQRAHVDLGVSQAYEVLRLPALPRHVIAVLVHDGGGQAEHVPDLTEVPILHK